MNNKADVWAELTPADLIERMYERTNADGVLYVPSFFTDEDFEGEKSLRCVMGWEKPDDCFAVLQEYDQLRSAIEQIAERCDRGGNFDEGGYEALTEKQKAVCDTYLCGFASDDIFDTERIYEIHESLATVALIREHCADILAGKELDECSADFLRDYMKEKVSEEDEAYYQRFNQARDQEARQRFGNSPFARPLVMHAWRYFRVLTLEAPDPILNNEAKALAFALTLFRWCKRYEYVDSAVRCHFDRLNQTE